MVKKFLTQIVEFLGIGTAKNFAFTLEIDEGPCLKEIPPAIVVFDTPASLPHGKVISGRKLKQSQKSAKPKGKFRTSQHLIEFSEKLCERLCVLALQENSCALIVSTDLYFNKGITTLFKKLRAELDVHGFSQLTIHWATPGLVLDLGRSRQAEAKSNVKTELEESKHREQFIKFLVTGLDLRASDMHVEYREQNATIRYTIDSKLYVSPEYPQGKIFPTVAKGAVAHAFGFMLDKGSNSGSHYDTTQHHSCTITFDDVAGRSVKLRMQSNPTINGCFDLIARLQPAGSYAKSLSFAELGYSSDQIRLLNQALVIRGGIVLFAGIPNSGKTTSTKACLEAVPDRDQKKFVSLADPNEYELPFVSHATIQGNLDSELKRSLSYKVNSASWLRGNPHIFDMGEIRDMASGNTAVTAARIGCITLATIHVDSALTIPARLTADPINLDIKSLCMQNTLKLLVYQALVPILCEECKIPLSSASSEKQNLMARISKKFGVSISNVNCYGSGCRTCRGTGHFGQTLAAEIIKPHWKFLEAIKTESLHEAALIWHSEFDGSWESDSMAGKPAFAHALKKILDGKIDISELMAFGDPDDFDLSPFKRKTDSSVKSHVVSIQDTEELAA